MITSMLDAHSLRPKEDFSTLKENYVIFITENDVIGKGKPLYRIEETGDLFGDGEHIIYVNGANRNGTTELGKLMHDFFCTDPDDMHFQQLAKKTRYCKEDEKGVATMCKVLEDMRTEVARETAEREKAKIAMRMIADGIEPEKIAAYSGLTLEKVQELAKEKTG